MLCLSVILLCYRIACLWFCNEKFCNKTGRYLCWTLDIVGLHGPAFLLWVCYYILHFIFLLCFFVNLLKVHDSLNSIFLVVLVFGFYLKSTILYTNWWSSVFTRHYPSMIYVDACSCHLFIFTLTSHFNHWICYVYLVILLLMDTEVFFSFLNTTNNHVPLSWYKFVWVILGVYQGVELLYHVHI